MKPRSLLLCATLPAFLYACGLFDGPPPKTPCDPATLAAITATCESEAECNRLLDEREATCAKRIEAGE
jgi:hypothetical protein